VQKRLGVLLFLRPQPGIDFRNVDRAAGQRIAIADQAAEELPAAFLVIDGVNDDAGVEEVGGNRLADGHIL